jgi:hypothetical protein
MASFQTIAQRWRPAKIVLANSDTLKGQARLENDRFIFLRQEGKSAVQKFDYKDVRIAYIDDEVFTSTQLANIKNAKGKTIFDSTFVKVLIDGDIKLYYKENKSNRQSPKSFIIQKKDSSALELSQRIMQVNNSGAIQNLRLDAYKNQLAKLLEDCPSLNKTITRSDYFNETDMTAVIKKYIDCKGVSTKFLKPPKQRKTEITLMAGWDVTRIKFSSPFYYLSSSYTYSQKPFFGAQFAMPITRSGRLKLIGEGLFKSTSIQMYESEPGFENSQTTIKISYLHVNVGLKYSLPIGSHVNVDLLGAFSVGPILSKSFVRIVNHSYESNDFSFNSAESNVFVGFGIRFNERFGLTIRDEVAISNFTEYLDVSTTSNHVYYGLTYKIGKQKKDSK